MLAAVVLLAGFAWFAFRSVQPDVMELSYPRKYKSIVTEQAAEYDLEESLVYAVIKAESNFDAEAVSSVGAVGLMQMMPETFYWMQTHVGETYDESALYEPEVRQEKLLTNFLTEKTGIFSRSLLLSVISVSTYI